MGDVKTAINLEGLPKPPFRYSQVIRAGRFIFPSGVIASDYVDGIAEDASVDPGRPYHVRRVVPQTEWIYRRLDDLLTKAGSSIQDIVRIDQFFAERDDKPAYFPIKNRVLVGDRPASCALQMSGLLVPDAAVMVDSYAIVPDHKFVKLGCNSTDAPRIVAGHSMAVRAGDWIWTSGATPTDLRVTTPYPWGTDGTAGLADEARANPNFSYDYPLPKQLEYVLKRLRAYLRAAGSDFEHVVKAQVYLTDMTDLADFTGVWRSYIPDSVATLIAPLTKTGISGGRLEVSLMALSADAKTPVEVIPSNGSECLGPIPSAVRVGDMLLLSGQSATAVSGYDPAARVNPRQPYLRSKARLEMESILRRITKICESAGGTIDSVVKAVLFFADLSDVPAAMEVWSQAFGENPPAISIVHSTAPQVLPECSLTVDVYAAL